PPSTPALTILSLHDALPIYHAVHQPAAVTALHGFLPALLPVFGQIAGDHFNHVGHGGHTDHAAVFIHHHGHVHARILEQIQQAEDRKSTRLNSSHVSISYAV